VVEGEIPTGRLLPVRINGAMAYDLSGVIDTNHQIIGLAQIQDPA
jgi:hypothetical protein